MQHPLVVGLDIGTGGARAIALDFTGALVGAGRADFPNGATHTVGPNVEQDPQIWTQAAQAALKDLTRSLPDGCPISAIAVDATSGTFLLADEANRPLTPGVMYNDLRAAADAPAVSATLAEALKPYGIEIAPSFALPKIVYLARENPSLFARCRRVIHQTDWIVGMLSGRYDLTDISTALKTGADPGTLTWPSAIQSRLGIPLALLPKIVPSGVAIVQITNEAAAATGLPSGIPVVSGCTDGTAGCLASGASHPGDLNVTLGTTMVFKAISPAPLIDPDGAIYNHRHPAGGFLPGAASSTGAEWVAAHFDKAELSELSQQAAALLPTDRLTYPLMKTGERFPFSCPSAKGFGLEEIENPAKRLAAGMEAVAFLERLGIEKMGRLGLKISGTIFATGGGAAANEIWLRIRASVNRRAYGVPEQPECAVGAAILAASPSLGGCAQATRRMVRIARRVEPNVHLSDQYDQQFHHFKDELHRRGYL